MRAAVIIGVNQVKSGLPKLTAAASGAREVADWLGRNRYEVDLITDESDPVERSAIFKAVQKRTDAGNVERLVIYFAGHGFLKGPLDEYWLLSGAPDDAAEAVDVTLSSAMARYRGIPQIIFISDACRVVPKTSIHSGITGTSIFPNARPAAEGAEFDFYYATHPGDPAHERRANEARKAHGLFTQELLGAHVDAPPEALMSIEGRDYVRNRWLKRVLRDRVDLRAQGISLAISQKPDVQLQIFDGYIAQNERSASNNSAPLAPPAPSIEKPDPDLSSLIPFNSSVSDGGRGRRYSCEAHCAGQPCLSGSGSEDRAGRAPSIGLVGPGCEPDLPRRRDHRRGDGTCRPRRPRVPKFRLVDRLRSGRRTRLHFELQGPAGQVAIRFADGTGCSCRCCANMPATSCEPVGGRSR